MVCFERAERLCNRCPALFQATMTIEIRGMGSTVFIIRGEFVGMGERKAGSREFALDFLGGLCIITIIRTNVLIMVTQTGRGLHVTPYQVYL
jgi:hypothetical protein